MKRALLAATGFVAAWLLFRKWHLRWGATGEDVARSLPGDEVIPNADLVATRAMTIDAHPQAVWPWLAQLGQGRGGFYSYDVLENLVGCDIHSSDVIVDQWQLPVAGDEFKLHPEVAPSVVEVRPGEALVVRGGAPMGEVSAPYDFVWAFVIVDDADLAARSRLVVRERYKYEKPWAPLIVEPVEVVSFFMTQKMMRGIRERAERTVQVAN